MEEFEIEITETLSKVVKVRAKNKCEALERVERDYKNSEIILSADDFVDYEIKVV